MHIEDLLKFNYHWQVAETLASPYPHKRKLFYRVSKELDSRFILTLSGLRRTGKSVLQQQVIEAFREANPSIPPQHILRFSFETEDSLDLLPSSELQALLDLYFRGVLRQHPAKPTQKILIALDEIQNIRNWQSVVKTYYDLNENIKFVLTGSSSLYLQENAESLVGRVLDFYLPCLDFEEFLQLTESTLKLPFCHQVGDLQQVIPFYLTLDAITLFEQFLLLGGFPDTALMFKKGENTSQILHFIREAIVHRIVNKDLRKYFNLEHTHADERLMEICAAESGGFVVNKNLATQVGLSEVSIKKHLDVFAKSALIYRVSRFDRKLRRQIQASRKIYVASPCVMFALHYKPTLEDTAWVGHAAETYALNQLRGYAHDIYVERNVISHEEIDFYLPTENILVECKYSDRVDVRDFRYLKKQSKSLKMPGLVLTKDAWLHEDVFGFPLLLL